MHLVKYVRPGTSEETYRRYKNMQSHEVRAIARKWGKKHNWVWATIHKEY